MVVHRDWLRTGAVAMTYIMHTSDLPIREQRLLIGYNVAYGHSSVATEGYDVRTSILSVFNMILL